MGGEEGVVGAVGGVVVIIVNGTSLLGVGGMDTVVDDTLGALACMDVSVKACGAVVAEGTKLDIDWLFLEQPALEPIKNNNTTATKEAFKVLSFITPSIEHLSK